MSVQEILQAQRAEPDVANARARLVIDQYGAPVGMMLWPMDSVSMPLTLSDPGGSRPRPPSRPSDPHRTVVLKPQIVMAQEDEGTVSGYIWRVDSGDLAVLMAQDPRIFQSLARYFGPL